MGSMSCGTGGVKEGVGKVYNERTVPECHHSVFFCPYNMKCLVSVPIANVSYTSKSQT